MYVGVLFIAGYFMIVPGLCELGVYLASKRKRGAKGVDFNFTVYPLV